MRLTSRAAASPGSIRASIRFAGCSLRVSKCGLSVASNRPTDGRCPEARANQTDEGFKVGAIGRLPDQFLADLKVFLLRVHGCESGETYRTPLAKFSSYQKWLIMDA